MPVFHGDRWLHLLVFIWERTTKNLQLLQTRVTHTLSCVWLWCTSTFLVEEMKGHQAAESTTRDQLLWAAPTSRSLPVPAASLGAGACGAGTVAWSQEPAGNKGGNSASESKPGLSLNASLLAHGKVRDTLICCHLPRAGWPGWRCSIRRISGKAARIPWSHSD